MARNFSTMPKRIGNIKNKFLTREHIMLNIEALLTNEKQHKWAPASKRRWEKFMSNYDANVNYIYKVLYNQTWNPKKPKVFYKNERGKVRDIYTSEPIDQIIDNLLTDCLKYVFMEKKQLFHPCAYGSIKGKGQHEMRSKILSKIRHRDDLFVAVEDTRKYYPTVSHERLIMHCRKHIKDEWLMWLIETTIKRSGDRGIVLGLASSNILGHVNHAEIDWTMYLKYGVRRYYRFCDDKFMIHKNSNYLHTVAREMIRLTKENGQEIKPDWQVVNISKQPIKCLGGMLSSKGGRLTTSSRRRTERMMRHYEKNYEPENIIRSWAGVQGSFKGLDLSNLLNY